MKELSLHILDIAQNSVRVAAQNIVIKVWELKSENIFKFSIVDDGPGIPEKIYADIKNPFITTRTTRKVGLGIALLDDTCKLCNGNLHIYTEKNKGTQIEASFEYDHIDRPPMGDIAGTITGLICSNEKINIEYWHYYNDDFFNISTEEIKDILGEDIPLTNIEIIQWLKSYIVENIDELKKKKK